MTTSEKRETKSNEADILEYWKVVRKNYRMIGAIVLAISIGALIISLLLPKEYKAEALLMPVSSQSGGGSLSSLLSNFGGLASLAGLNMPGGGSDDSLKIMAILRSRSLTERVINKENLMPVLFRDKWDAEGMRWKSDEGALPTMEAAVKSMKGHMTFIEGKKDKTIRIEGVFEDPDLAARVVNAYIGELQYFITENAFTVAKRNRIFIEDQLEENKKEFLEAGKEISSFYKKNRISGAESELDVDVDIVTNTKGGLEPSDIALASADKISKLFIEKNDLDKKIEEASIVKHVPQQVYLNYLLLRRELLGKINAMLTSQYEMARIDESKEELSFQVIDEAVPPVKKFKPKRGLICIMAFMASLFLALFIVFARENLQRLAHNARRA